MRPCEHDRPSCPAPQAPVPARRGTAAAARHRVPYCTSRASPGLAPPPSPRRAPSHRRRGRAAAWRRFLQISRRGGTTRRRLCTGRLGPSDAAAGLPAARAPWAPAADPSGPSLAAAAVAAARARLGVHLSSLGLEGRFSRQSFAYLKSSDLQRPNY